MFGHSSIFNNLGPSAIRSGHKLCFVLSQIPALIFALCFLPFAVLKEATPTDLLPLGKISNSLLFALLVSIFIMSLTFYRTWF